MWQSSLEWCDSMKVVKIMKYALAGDAYKGGSNDGLVGTAIECILGKSSQPIKLYSELVRRKTRQIYGIGD